MAEIVDDEIVGGAIESDRASKKSLDPGFKRNLKIIGGVVLAAVVTVVLLLMGGDGKSNAQGKLSAVNVGGGGRVSSVDMSPAMEDMLAEKERQEADSARQRGESYLPSDPRPTQSLPAPVLAPVIPQSALAQSSYMGPASQFDSANQAESFKRQREGLDRQIAGLLVPLGAVSSGGVRQRIDVAQPTQANDESLKGRPSPSSGDAESLARSAAPIRDSIVPGHYIAAAHLSNALVVPSGKTVYASATIKAGPLAGAFLTGSAVVVGEGLELKFSKMSINGSFYDVDVTALDEATAANALSGDVDRRLLQRWIMPVAMATVGGFFEAKSQPGTTIVNVGGGFDGPTQGLETPALTREQARSAGVAAGVAIAQREVEKSAQAPIVVSKQMNMPMGLLFNSPVSAGDAK